MDSQTLNKIFAVIHRRKSADPAESYVAKLFAKGREKIAQKVGEEAVEVAIAAAGDNNDAIVQESADLLFHLMVLWADADIDIGEVMQELDRRQGNSGIDEKKNRQQPY